MDKTDLLQLAYKMHIDPKITGSFEISAFNKKLKELLKPKIHGQGEHDEEILVVGFDEEEEPEEINNVVGGFDIDRYIYNPAKNKEVENSKLSLDDFVDSEPSKINFDDFI